MSKKKVILAVRFWTRAKGLLFEKPHKHTLALCPCQSVHTFGMRYPIDIAFLDEAGRVLRVVRNMGPWRKKYCHKAAIVLERFASEEEWFSEGDVVHLEILSSRVEEDKKNNKNKSREAGTDKEEAKEAPVGRLLVERRSSYENLSNL